MSWAFLFSFVPCLGPVTFDETHNDQGNVLVEDLLYDNRVMTREPNEFSSWCNQVNCYASIGVSFDFTELYLTPSSGCWGNRCSFAEVPRSAFVASIC